jgi:hypothetical protein
MHRPHTLRVQGKEGLAWENAAENNGPFEMLDHHATSAPYGCIILIARPLFTPWPMFTQGDSS